MSSNTLFLRLDAPMQSWGNQESKFVVRRTGEAPTKSGVIGLLCAALGVTRSEAADVWLTRLAELRMGVRIDAPGIRWWDYHTVGARMDMRIAEGARKTKQGALLTRREYLCDASFLVALQGEPALITELSAAIRNPRWTLYLGRKCCPPARPVWEQPAGEFPDMLSAITSIAWRKRMSGDMPPQSIDCLLEWRATPEEAEAPADALIWYDVPLTLEPPSHRARFVVRRRLPVGRNCEVNIADKAAHSATPVPPRQRADYGNTEYKKRRAERMERDCGLCVFCKAPATTVQHVTYRRAGGDEDQEDLRSLCRLCHDAVTMIEYGLGMGLDRIDPEELRWREIITAKRAEIVKFRSLETRRRRLAAKEVE